MSYLTGPGQPAPEPYDDSWPSYAPPPGPYAPAPPGPYAPAPASYAPQPGWDPTQGYAPPQQPGWDPGWNPGYGPGFVPAPAPANPAAAFASAALFLACAIQSFVFAFSTWSSGANPHLMAALVGVVFSEDVTGNRDFAISVTMTVACSTTTFALALFARLNFVRWILVGIGGIVVVYYFFALLYIAANGGARYVAVPAVALLLWAAATAVALLPVTVKAMRGR